MIYDLVRQFLSHTYATSFKSNGFCVGIAACGRNERPANQRQIKKAERCELKLTSELVQWQVEAVEEADGVVGCP